MCAANGEKRNNNPLVHAKFQCTVFIDIIVEFHFQFFAIPLHLGVRRQFLFVLQDHHCVQHSHTRKIVHQLISIGMGTHFFHILGFLCPCTGFPLRLDVSVFPCFAYNASWCVVWELDTEFCQLKIVQTVSLARNISLWAINKYLFNRREKMKISLINAI